MTGIIKDIPEWDIVCEACGKTEHQRGICGPTLRCKECCEKLRLAFWKVYDGGPLKDFWAVYYDTVDKP